MFYTNSTYMFLTVFNFSLINYRICLKSLNIKVYLICGSIDSLGMYISNANFIQVQSQ